MEYQTTSRHQTLQQMISGSQPLLWDFDKNEAPTDISTYHLHFTWKANKTVKNFTATTMKVDTNRVKYGFTSFPPTLLHKHMVL